MASAVLASRNVTNWSSHQQQPKTTTSTTTQQSSSSNYMGKFPPFMNPNPNPNPSLSNFNNQNHNSRKQLHQNGGTVAKSSTTTNDVTAAFHRQQRTNSFSHLVSFDISGCSKTEIRELKSQLMSELDKVRNLSSRIESGTVVAASKKRPSPFPPSFKDPKRVAMVNGKPDHHHNNQQHQQRQSPQPAAQQSQPRYVASAQVMKMCGTVLRKLMSQKGGIWFNTPVDVVGMGLIDYHTVVRRPMDLGTIKNRLDAKEYDTPEEFAADVRLTFNNALLYNPKGHEVNTYAEQYLALFEKWFQAILQKFQTEKQLHLQSVARKNVAARLEIHRREREEDQVVEDEVRAVPASSWSKLPSPEPPKMKKQSPKPEPVAPVAPSPRARTPVPTPVRAPVAAPVVPVRTPTPPPPMREPLPSPVKLQDAVESVVERHRVESERGESRRGRRKGSGGKLPKPKAKDPSKREMTMDEKQKLGHGLQSLPEEKMTQVIQIIRRRNGQLTQDGDEIELDIEAVDTETLWELDRFVTNYKKLVSKIRRQALMDSQNNNNVGLSDDTIQVGGSDRVIEPAKAKRGGGGGDMGEEDVDIGDEMPVNHFPPVEIDKEDDDRQQHGGGGGGGDGDGDSSSSSSESSSSSDDSSSSDSDSGSSSGSDSDVDDAQSRDNESKNIHR